MFQKFVDVKVSLVNIIGWAVAIIGATATISSMYGEQKQKLLYLAERQTKIELYLDRIEASQANLITMIARLEVEMRKPAVVLPATRSSK